jgi:glycosyltransferase involved in cell wall biosynthesis
VRLAWFTPLPPVTSGVAHYSLNALAGIVPAHSVDVFVASAAELSFARANQIQACSAHDFVWMHQRAPYDLVVYQLGNSRCHDFTWAYLFQYPGLVVLHDAHLHHARAAYLLERGLAAEYAAELVFNHPDVPAERAGLGTAGFGGPIAYFWPMLRTVVQSARRVAVHNAWVAAGLRESFEAPVDVIRLGVDDPFAESGHRDAELVRGRTRARLGLAPDAFVALAYGGVTPEKRIGEVMRAVAETRDSLPDLRLLIVGASSGAYDAEAEARAAGIADRVAITGHVRSEELPDYLLASDAALCLRWPTARETSAAWVQCIAAGLPTVITDLAHLTHIPTLEPRAWTVRHLDTGGGTPAPVAISVDLSDEASLIGRALRRLMRDATLRASLGRAARARFEAHHTLAHMADDYLRVIDVASTASAPPAVLPPHLRPDPLRLAKALASGVGVDLRLE